MEGSFRVALQVSCYVLCLLDCYQSSMSMQHNVACCRCYLFVHYYVACYYQCTVWFVMNADVYPILCDLLPV